MKSKKPYLLRAIYSWIVDNGLTPYVLVDATKEGVCVVEEFIRDGKIVLNIDEDAVDNLCLDDDSISFTAYFGSANEAKQLYAPIESVLAIFANEIGDGITFDEEKPATLKQRISSAAKDKILKKIAVRRGKSEDSSKKKTIEKPSLKIVK
jgi:stringent starvation protein B